MITDNYIKMCEKAEEIQKLCKYEGGEYYINVDKEIEFMPLNLTEKMKEWYKYYYHKWLPTQEQLWEEIWELEKTCTFSHSFDISRYDKNNINLLVRSISNESGYINEYLKQNTIQECLLEYIYEVKYNKIWTGEKWVEAK